MVALNRLSALPLAEAGRSSCTSPRSGSRLPSRASPATSRPIVETDGSQNGEFIAAAAEPVVSPEAASTTAAVIGSSLSLAITDLRSVGYADICNQCSVVAGCGVTARCHLVGCVRGEEAAVAETTVAGVLAELAALEDPRAREVNLKHGDDHGVNLGQLRAVAKRLKTQQDLARELWQTDDTSAKLL